MLPSTVSCAGLRFTLPLFVGVNQTTPRFQNGSDVTENATLVGSTLSGAIARCGVSGYVGCDGLNQNPIALPGTSTAIVPPIGAMVRRIFPSNDPKRGAICNA